MQPIQSCRQRDVRLWVVRRELESGPVLRLGLAETQLLTISFRACQVGTVRFTHDLSRSLDLVQGRLGTVQLQVCICQAKMRLAILRAKLNCGLEVFRAPT